MARGLDPDANDYALADRLGKTPDEIRAMANRDYFGLVAWFGLQAEREKHAQVHAAASARRR